MTTKAFESTRKTSRRRIRATRRSTKTAWKHTAWKQTAWKQTAWKQTAWRQTAWKQTASSSTATRRRRKILIKYSITLSLSLSPGYLRWVTVAAQYSALKGTRLWDFLSRSSVTTPLRASLREREIERKREIECEREREREREKKERGKERKRVREEEREWERERNKE